jgi:cellulose synthase/poly-beta-1,6-N-acetylglucosamine synthase-like glycosyltransferase
MILFVAALYAATAGLFYLAATSEYTAEASYDPIRTAMLILLMPVLIKYTFQLICAPLYSVVCRKRKRSHSKSTPTVSVLIPAWNEEVGIIKTIRSVLNTNYPALQLLVINDGSTDSTHKKVSRFIDQYRENGHAGAELKYLNLCNGGKAHALNRALKHVTGEIVITIDADSVMDPEAISHLVKHFDDPRVGGVAGNVIIGNHKKPIEWMQQMEYLYGFFFKRSDALFNSVYIIGGAAAAYRRQVLEEVGDFDDTIITEDIELSTRILSHGYKTRYAADAVIYTEPPSDLSGLCSQRLRWKYGRIMTFIKYRKLFFSRQPEHNPYLTWFILPIAVYAELLLLIEAAMLLIFFFYTIRTSDYMPLIFTVILLTIIISIQILTDPKTRNHRNLLLLAPAAWLLFYAIDMIEFQALIRSIKRLVTRKEIQWQKWKRLGLLEGSERYAPNYN